MQKNIHNTYEQIPKNKKTTFTGNKIQKYASGNDNNLKK